MNQIDTHARRAQCARQLRGPALHRQHGKKEQKRNRHEPPPNKCRDNSAQENMTGGLPDNGNRANRGGNRGNRGGANRGGNRGGNGGNRGGNGGNRGGNGGGNGGRARR